MAISLRLSKKDEELFKKYAKMHNMTVSELIKKSVLNTIEDELDLQTYREMLKEYQADPRTVDLDKVIGD